MLNIVLYQMMLLLQILAFFLEELRNSYIQMNFNVNVRSKIFTDDWGSLKKSIKDFNSLKRYMPIRVEVDEKKSLIEILKDNKILNTSNTESQEKDERFESIISFPKDRKSVVVGKECRSRWSTYH